MYIRGRILWNSTELAEADPIARIVCKGVVLGLCFVVVFHSVLSSFAIILLRKRVMIALNVFL